MSHLPHAAVLMLMLSVGMTLRFSEIITNWRRLTWVHWARLLLATFIVPPLMAPGLVMPWPRHWSWGFTRRSPAGSAKAGRSKLPVPFCPLSAPPIA